MKEDYYLRRKSLLTEWQKTAHATEENSVHRLKKKETATLSAGEEEGAESSFGRSAKGQEIAKGGKRKFGIPS